MSTITNKLLNNETQEREKNGPLCLNNFHLRNTCTATLRIPD